ncbi:metalloendopeptidase [Streptococcus criceti]|uniref:Endopeptidase O n=1 Tax=Streptococcus criceti HS-6 TaxID=873449 RepID=G5JSN6_STRCG|nr:M13 family metallopeptidase [Streptococcus criceti]EHI75074.1 hypothetical protein STRCR_0934 [Streptococcus criceti HS-6]SUN37515.1 metalloendopeptidase [Streptococcus criceti]
MKKAKTQTKKKMKRRTKRVLWGTGAVLILALAGGGYYAYKNFIPHKVSFDKNARAQSNFFQYINKDYLAKTKIPKDRATQGVTDELQDKADKQLMSDLDELAAKKKSTKVDGMNVVIDYYSMATDSKARSKNGTKPAKKYLKQLDDLDSLSQLNQSYKDLTMEGIVLPVNISLVPQDTDTSRYILSYSETGGILPDTSTYKDKNQSQQYFRAYKEAATAVMKDMGYSKSESEKMVEQTISLDKKMAKYRMSAEDASDQTKIYHEVSSNQLKSYSKDLDLMGLGSNLVGHSVDKVDVTNPKYFKALSKFMNQKNFKEVKSWSLVQNAMNMTNYLDHSTQKDAGKYQTMMTGQSQLPSQKKLAYNLVSQSFSDSLGVYYGQEHFGQNAKNDATKMVKKITKTYKERLENNSWLSQATKDKAIEKLDSMTYNIGYSDYVEKDFYQNISIDKSKSLLDNDMAITKKWMSYQFSKFDQPVNKQVGGVSSFVVNAFYDPTNNSINLDAAILQDPFYSKKNSDEDNYGGIGIVIGHEISHAFDSNGANYDKNGNHKNWWTKADHRAFDKKTNTLIQQWDGLEYAGVKVNAKQTVTENAADLSGANVALQALKEQDSSPNLKAFFKSYAISFREVGYVQYYKSVIPTDVHAPAELRVNQIVKNIDDFYKAYDIKKGDKMYMDKKDRLTIW